MADRELHCAGLMRAAIRGDADAYRSLLRELTPVLRGVTNRGFSRYGLGSGDVEDVVQETLLAVHLKRQTWDERQPLLPWVWAIAHNKLVDSLRRRGRRVHVPIHDIAETLADDREPVDINGVDAERVLATLGDRQREIVLAISIKGESARQVAERLGMKEGAVRVVLHRALQAMAKAFRTNPS